MFGRIALLLRFGSFVPGVGILSGVASAVASIFQASVSFFSTAIGKYVGIGLLGGALFLAGDIRGERHEKAAWDEASAAADQARAARDESIKQSTSAEAGAQIKSLEARAIELQKQVDDYAKTAKPAAAACSLTADDVRRLRQLK